MPGTSTDRASSDLRWDVIPDRDLVRVVATGELDIGSAPGLDAALRELRDVGFQRLLLDVHDLGFIDLHGTYLLARWSELSLLDGFELGVLVGIDGVVAALLDDTGMRARVRCV